jgi:hypothetical protein
MQTFALITLTPRLIGGRIKNLRQLDMFLHYSTGIAGMPSIQPITFAFRGRNSLPLS